MSPSLQGRSASRILLVNDDPTVTDACSRALRLDGHEVWAALSAGDGLRLARVHAPNAVVIDLRVPLSSSLALAGRLRELPAGGTAAIGVVSSDRKPTIPTLDEASRLGVHVRYKPLWLTELVALARSLVTPG